MTIANECMVVSLHVSLWQGYRLDKETTRKVVHDANASDDAARVNKHLIPKVMLADVQSAAGALRNHFYEKTLPWKDNGDRLLTRKLYMSFMQEHEGLRRDFDQASKIFVTERYPAARDQAAFRMGNLFKDGDYPHQDELMNKFRVSLDIDAVTTAGDFRCQVEDSEEVKERIEKAMQERISKAMSDVWQRLADMIGSLAERLNGDEGGVIRKSTLNNLHEIVEILPGLNIADCPHLEKVRQDIEATLLGYEAKDLALGKVETRKQVGSEAARIMSDMESYMKAFGAFGGQ
jgi:hypothetical protein